MEWNATAILDRGISQEHKVDSGRLTSQVPSPHLSSRDRAHEMLSLPSPGPILGDTDTFVYAWTGFSRQHISRDFENELIAD